MHILNNGFSFSFLILFNKHIMCFYDGVIVKTDGGEKCTVLLLGI